MINNLLNEDSQAILLICSNLAINSAEKENLKPFTLTEWNILANKISNSNFKSPKTFFHTSYKDWIDNINISKEEAERIDRLLNRGVQLAIQLDRLSSKGIWITTRAEATYPILLKDKLKQKCPVILYCAGNPNLFKTKGAAIVGSRNIDEKGLDFTKNLSERCTKEGYTIISGGAKGVDSIAQNTALESDGTVISVVSDSMDLKIKAKDCRQNIMGNKLLVVSPFHPDITFKVYNAMERNKYIYTLSNFAVAVSSDYNKGGTWAGASENLKNKWVPLLVRKEDVMPKGNEELLKIGASPLTMELILNRNIPIAEWVNKEQYNSTKVEEEQISLDQYIKKDESNIAYKKLKNDVIINKNQVVKVEITGFKNLTAYEIIKPYILQILVREKTLDELINLFDLKKSQMQSWLEKLEKEDLIKKFNRPVRYLKK